LLIWLSNKAYKAYKVQVELKTEIQTSDSYASNPAKKKLIPGKNQIGRFEFARKYRHRDNQGLSRIGLDLMEFDIRVGSTILLNFFEKSDEAKVIETVKTSFSTCKSKIFTKKSKTASY
jgi:hypothetical protein